ncbi:SDR family oxidoreductase [Pantoea sp. Nvir]|uniref:SDR family oxidoreductase n=1 Tax=Pantoea sp. Nvir TaxID=2576760 RepID=UPI001359243E|nr:SDR family oxidoreductase [Pantoea sp. Nvir]MXP66648.1 SDR family oxidoreductase [Pantoea sp. Nvir]CAJ0991957.1 Protein YeeZ [Pantoea sp. Nvir]
MKKVAIIGLGWLGMPLALALTARGWQVTGSKTMSDGIEAARRCGIDAVQLELMPEINCDARDLGTLFSAEVLVVTLPASNTVEGSKIYMQAVQNIVSRALENHVSHIIFTSSTSVYGSGNGVIRESSTLQPETVAGKTLAALESWLHDLPSTYVDILRLAGLVGPKRHPSRSLDGKIRLNNGGYGVNLVHVDDVVSAITLLLQMPKGGGRIYNLCASQHPSRENFYPAVSRQLGLIPPTFLPSNHGEIGKLIDGSLICKELGFEYRYDNPEKMPLE